MNYSYDGRESEDDFGASSHLDELQEQRRRQGDQLSEKDATITRLQAELEQEQLLATTFMKQRDQLAAEVERHIIQFRSIEASLGTLDQSEAIDDERALPDWASTKVAEIVERLRKPREVNEC